MGVQKRCVTFDSFFFTATFVILRAVSSMIRGYSIMTFRKFSVAIVCSSIALACFAGVSANAADKSKGSSVDKTQGEVDEVVQKRKEAAAAASAKAVADGKVASEARDAASQADSERFDRDRESANVSDEVRKARVRYEEALKEAAALNAQLENLKQEKHLEQTQKIIDELESSVAANPDNKEKKAALARWKIDLEKEKKAHPSAVRELEIRQVVALASGGKKINWNSLIHAKDSELVQKSQEVAKASVEGLIQSGKKVVAVAKAGVAHVKSGYRGIQKDHAETARKGSENESKAQERQAEKLEVKDHTLDSLADRWKAGMKKLKRSCVKHEQYAWMGFRVAGEKINFTRKLAADYKVSRDGNKNDRELYSKLYGPKVDCESVPVEDLQRRKCVEWQWKEKEEREVESCRRLARKVLELEQKIEADGKAVQASDQKFSEKRALLGAPSSESDAADCDVSAGSCAPASGAVH